MIAHRKLDLDEASGYLALDEARQVGTDAERREEDANDEGELGNATPEQVARERASDELVDQAAGRDEQNGDVDEEREHRRARGLLAAAPATTVDGCTADAGGRAA